MGLYCFPCLREGMLPVLLMNTVVSVALLMNMLRYLFVLMGAASNSEEDSSNESSLGSSRSRRVSISRYGSLCKNRGCIARTGDDSTCTCGGNGHIWPLMECSVCLSRFIADEEVNLVSSFMFWNKIRTENMKGCGCSAASSAILMYKQGWPSPNFSFERPYKNCSKIHSLAC